MMIKLYNLELQRRTKNKPSTESAIIQPLVKWMLASTQGKLAQDQVFYHFLLGGLILFSSNKLKYFFSSVYWKLNSYRICLVWLKLGIFAVPVQWFRKQFHQQLDALLSQELRDLLRLSQMHLVFSLMDLFILSLLLRAKDATYHLPLRHGHLIAVICTRWHFSVPYITWMCYI